MRLKNDRFRTGGVQKKKTELEKCCRLKSCRAGKAIVPTALTGGSEMSAGKNMIKPVGR